MIISQKYFIVQVYLWESYVPVFLYILTRKFDNSRQMSGKVSLRFLDCYLAVI